MKVLFHWHIWSIYSGFNVIQSLYIDYFYVKIPTLDVQYHINIAADGFASYLLPLY